jgi:hypothetical protein
MSETIWVRRKSKVGTNESGDDFDHSLFCELADNLDDLADSLSVARLSNFFDTTDLQFNLSDDDLPESWIVENEEWYPPDAALVALNTIIESLNANDVKWAEGNTKFELIEELEDCASKVARAAQENDQFHFCIVM